MRPYFFLLMFTLFSEKTITQEWKYLVKDDLRTSAVLSWVDEEGNSYHNIARFEPRGQNGSAEINKHVLILDKNGRFKGIFQISRCENRALLLPFSNNNYLSSGFNCNDKKGSSKPSRVYNSQGEIVKTGEGIDLHHFAQVRTDKGYTVFAASGFTNDQDQLQIGSIDWDFNINIKTVDLKPLRRPGLGMLNKFLDPVQADDGGWVIPWHYGKVNGPRITPEDGLIYKTDGKTILWTYPAPVKHMVMDLQKAGNNYVALIATGQMGLQHAHIIDGKGKKVKILDLKNEGFLEQMLVLKTEIILVSRSRKNPPDGLIIYRYDFDGNLLGERVLPVDGFTDVNHVLPFGNKSLLLTGSFSNNNNNPGMVAFVWKIDLGKKDEPVLAGKEKELPKNPVHDVAAAKDDEPAPSEPSIAGSNFDFISEEALAVSLFPNPASIYINFKLENPRSPGAKYFIKIFSVDGKPVRQDSFTGEQYEMNIESFTPGTYIYQIFTSSDGKNEFISGKFIKIRG